MDFLKDFLKATAFGAMLLAIREGAGPEIGNPDRSWPIR